jgi:hypothetical protein
MIASGVLQNGLSSDEWEGGGPKKPGEGLEHLWAVWRLWQFAHIFQCRLPARG